LKTFAFSYQPSNYSFNSQEHDDEIAGDGNSMTAEFWQYDARLGRRWNIDPVIKVWESPYLCFSGNPILYNDPNGDDVGYETKGDKARVFFKRIFNKDFRKDFNSKKQSADMFTYRLRPNMPKLEDARENFSNGRTYTSDGASDTGDGLTMVTANYNVDYSIGGGAGDALAGVIPIYRKEYIVRKHWKGDVSYEYSKTSKKTLYDDSHPISFRAFAYPDDITVDGLDSKGGVLPNGSINTIVNPMDDGSSNFPGAQPTNQLVLTPNPITPPYKSANVNWSPSNGTVKLRIGISTVSSRLKQDGTPENHKRSEWSVSYWKWRWSLKK